MKKGTPLLAILLLLFPLYSSAQGGKKAFKIKSANKVLQATIARKAEQARIEAQVNSFSSWKGTDYTRTVIPGFGTLHSFSVLPPYIGMDENVWRISTHRPPDIKTIEVYGVGIVRVLENGVLSLFVPSKRGHEHYVPCDMERLVYRLIAFNSRPEKIERWNEMSRQKTYTQLEYLAEDLYKLYKGQGIFVQDAQGQRAVLLSLPTDDISLILSGQPKPLYKQENVLLFYPHSRMVKLMSAKQENLKEFSLVDVNETSSLLAK